MRKSERTTTIFTFFNKNDYGVDEGCSDEIVFVRGLHTILSNLNIQDRKYVTVRSQFVSSSADRSEKNDVDENKHSLSVKVVQAVCVGYSRIENNQSNKNQDLDLNTPHPDSNINISTHPEKPSNVDNYVDNVEERGSDVVIFELIKSAAVAICLLASAEYEHQNIDRKKDRKQDGKQTSTEDMSVSVEMKSKGVINNLSVRTGTRHGQSQGEGEGQNLCLGQGQGQG